MYKTLWLMVIKVGEKWCQATKTWKFWWNFLAKSLFFSCYPSFAPFERPDAYKCYTFSESHGSRETRDIKSSTSKFDIKAQGILSSLRTQTGPWSDTASYTAPAHHKTIDWAPNWNLKIPRAQGGWGKEDGVECHRGFVLHSQPASRSLALALLLV